MRILYGGSVKPSNAVELLGVNNVDGALVGGASLKAADFLGIAEAYLLIRERILTMSAQRDRHGVVFGSDCKRRSGCPIFAARAWKCHESIVLSRLHIAGRSASASRILPG